MYIIKAQFKKTDKSKREKSCECKTDINYDNWAEERNY